MMARTVPSHELHRIVTMGLVYDAEHRFLIVQRSPHAKVFPNKWGSPGGGFSRKDYKNAQTLKDGWEDPLFAGLRRELREEVGIEVGSFEYVPHHFGHIRPDNVSVIGLRFMAPYVSGTVVLNHELVDHRWVFTTELKDYDLMGGFAEAIQEAKRRLLYKVL